MSYKIQTTNMPDGDDTLVEVDDAEFIDLSRMGLVRPGKGDVNAKGDLKRNVEATDEAKTATGQQPVLTQNGAQ